MKKLSVIIPVYNVEEYLCQCIDSVCGQSYQNLQIILVNDGSTDASLSICEDAEKRDSRIKVISQKNAGLSAARNTGMRYADGEYITFIDSDDYIGDNMFEYMLEQMDKENADISVCNMKKFWGNDSEDTPTGCEPEILSSIDALGKLYTDEQVIYVTAWGKIYNRSLFDEITYPEGKINEDVFTTYKLYAKAEKIIFLDIPFYKYRQREGSIIHAPFSIKNLDALNGLRQMKDFVLTIEGFSEKYNVIGEYIEKLIYFYYKLTTVKGDEKTIIKGNLYQETKTLCRQYKKYLTVKEKIKFSCFCMSPRIYRLLRGGLKDRLLKTVQKFRRRFLAFWYSLTPIQPNKIIFWSNNFTFYGCNPKHISEYLLQAYDNKFQIVWVFDSKIPVPADIDKKIKVVTYYSNEYLRELQTAHFVICNSRTNESFYWIKRRKQIYIQTWHSPLRLKNIEKDAEKFLSKNYIKSAICDSKKIDYIVSGCDFSTKIYRNSFWYKGKVLECGTPRIDYLLDKNNKFKAMEKIGLDCSCNYILYAPTFRSNYEFDYKINFSELISCCEQTFGGNWKVLYRLHPNLIYQRKTMTFDEQCIDVCSYSDMQELIMASSLLISDYSSCMFDAMYAKTKCVLYMPDYEQYSMNERNLYFDIKALPFYKSHNESELHKSIECFNEDEYQANIEKFLHSIGSFETGTACKSIAKLIAKEGIKQ